MKIALTCPNSAKHQRPAEHSSFQRFGFQYFSFTQISLFPQIPLFPRNPLFPASGPAIRSFNGLHPKSNFLAILFSAFAVAQCLSAAQQTPNIVVILADDLGYGSANCYGADTKHIKTPHINQLAKDGMRFTDANAPASVCSPTRYAMLTGRYAWRGAIKHSVLSPPEGPLVIEDELFTLPEFLQKEGYRTAHIGKWHLGYTNLKNATDLSAQPLEPGPRSLGFDYTFAVPNNHGWLPNIYVENETIWGLRSKGKNPYGKHKEGERGRPYHGYDAPQRVNDKVTQDLSDRACEWIAQTVKDQPDQPFFLYYCPIAVHKPISPSQKTIGTSGAGLYGDFIHDLDNTVGEIIAALDAAGVLEDTLVIFTSDNGGDVGEEEEAARALGFKCNGDLKGDKHLIWQGGLRVPLIVRWPEHIKAGSTSDLMINLVDLYATFQDLITGQVLEPEKTAADSFSFYNELIGKSSQSNSRKTMVMNDVAGVKALREGEWKYIDGTQLRPPVKQNKPELYNLKDDPGEATNVIDKYPEIAQKMAKALENIQSNDSERVVSGRGK